MRTVGGDATKAWDKLLESDGGDLEGSIVPDIAIEGILYDVKTVAATTDGMYGTERVAAVQGCLREVAGQVD